MQRLGGLDLLYLILCTLRRMLYLLMFSLVCSLTIPFITFEDNTDITTDLCEAELLLLPPSKSGGRAVFLHCFPSSCGQSLNRSYAGVLMALVHWSKIALWILMYSWAQGFSSREENSGVLWIFARVSERKFFSKLRLLFRCAFQIFHVTVTI